MENNFRYVGKISLRNRIDIPSIPITLDLIYRTENNSSSQIHLNEKYPPTSIILLKSGELESSKTEQLVKYSFISFTLNSISERL